MQLPSFLKPRLPQQLTQAQALLRESRFSEAETVLHKALQNHPKAGDAHYFLGICALLQNQNELALSSFEIAVGIDNKNVMYHFQRGLALQNLGRLVEAVACYREAVRIEPRFFGAHYNLGLVLKAQGEINGAIDCYRTAITHNPEMVQALNNLAILLTAMGEYSEAEQLLRRSIAVNPEFPNHYNSLGIVLAKLNRADEALACFEQALRIHPDFLDALLNMAEQLLHRGDHARAVEYQDKALAIQPDNQFVRFQRDSLTRRNPTCAPAEYVTRIFNEMAESFDDRLVGSLEYKTPKLMHDQLMLWLTERKRKISVLDLGCGTGLFGVEIKQSCGFLKGLDLSPNMVAKATQRSLYDELEVGDIVTYLKSETTRKYDLVVATDVFVYFGDLSEAFAGVSNVLAPGGVFGFSVEELPDDEGDYLLRTTGRFAHSRAYVSRLASIRGFKIQNALSAPLRKERFAACMGLVFILTLNAPGPN